MHTPSHVTDFMPVGDLGTYETTLLVLKRNSISCVCTYYSLSPETDLKNLFLESTDGLPHSLQVQKTPCINIPLPHFRGWFPDDLAFG